MLCVGAVELDMDKGAHSPQQTVKPCHLSPDSMVSKPAAPQLRSKRPLETKAEPKAQGRGSTGAYYRAMCDNTADAAALPPNKRTCIQQAAKSPEGPPACSGKPVEAPSAQQLQPKPAQQPSSTAMRSMAPMQKSPENASATLEEAAEAPSAQPPCRLKLKPAQQPSQQHAVANIEMIEAKPRPAQPAQKLLQTQQAAAPSAGTKALAAAQLQEAEVPEEVRQWRLKARQKLASWARSKQNPDEQFVQQEAREKARQEATQELLEFERSMLPGIPGNARLYPMVSPPFCHCRWCRCRVQ